MDNFSFSITSVDRPSFEGGISLAFRDYKAIGYAITPKNGLVFFWADTVKPDTYVALPFKLDAKGAADFAERWLAEQDYGREPDHDGHNRKGYTIEAGWNRFEWWSALCSITPTWAEFGK